MSDEVTLADVMNEVRELRTEVAKVKEVISAIEAVKTGGAIIAWMAKVIGGMMLMIVAWKFGPNAFAGVNK